MWFATARRGDETADTSLVLYSIGCLVTVRHRDEEDGSAGDVIQKSSSLVSLHPHAS